MTAVADLILCSDGGSSGGEVAAAACLLLTPENEPLVGLVAILGAATNNEAEIFGSLLGFAWILSAAEETKSIRWVADSEYVLKSATSYIHNWQRNGWKTADKKPVKNQGLWRLFLALSEGKKLISEHVRGHTGHPENETCDAALNWAKDNGVDVLSNRSTVSGVSIPDLPVEAPWIVCDGRALLEELRADTTGGVDPQSLVNLVGSGAQAVATKAVKAPPITALLRQLLTTLQAAEKFSRDKECIRLSEELRQLIGRFKS